MQRCQTPEGQVSYGYDSSYFNHLDAQRYGKDHLAMKPCQCSPSEGGRAYCCGDHTVCSTVIRLLNPQDSDQDQEKEFE